MENNFASKVELTRTADTNAYTAGDVLGSSTSAGGAVLEFSNVSGNVGGGNMGHFVITDVDLRIDLSSVPASMTSFRLHLYDTTPPSALADNAAWDLPSGDRPYYLGYVDLGTPVDVGSTLYVQTSAVNKKIWLKNSASVFGYLVTNGGYTPTSAATLGCRLNALGF